LSKRYSMENKFVYRDFNKIYLTYEYWCFSFKRRGKRLLAELGWLGDDDLFAEYPERFHYQIDNLLEYYRSLYHE
jgi:hypothetical protein